MTPSESIPDAGSITCLLTLAGICKSFADSPAIQEFSLTVSPGEVVALLAPSGAGKTTLLRIALGVLKPDQGQAELRMASSAVSLVTQEDPILPWLTVRENVLFAAKLTRHGGSDLEAEALMCRFGLGEFMDYYPRAISGGMAQLVAMCRALHHRGEFIVLDEAIAHIDEVHKSAVIAEVRKRVLEGSVGVLVVTQNPAEALMLADRIVVSSRRPLRYLSEQKNYLPRGRDASIVHSDAFGYELRHLRQCLHDLWT